MKISKMILSILSVAVLILVISMAVNEKYKGDCYNVKGTITANYNGWCIMSLLPKIIN